MSSDVPEPAVDMGGAEPAPAVVEKAVEWQVHLTSGEASEQDRQAFETWRAEHPSHREAHLRLARLWSRFDTLAPQAALSALHAPAARRKSRSRKTAAAATLAVAVVLGAMAAVSTPYPPTWLADHRTAVGEQRTIALADGSTLTLNTGSAVDVDFTAGQRSVVLHRGEILATVAKDAYRPFVVTTAQGTARALGTRFAVRATDDHMRIAVLESAVESCAADAAQGHGADGLADRDRACLRLVAGQGVSIGDDGTLARLAVDPQAEGAWTRHRLVVDDRPASEVVTEIARYHHGLVLAGDEALSTLRVSGVYPTDDPDRALDLLATSVPLRITRLGPLVWVHLP